MSFVWFALFAASVAVAFSFVFGPSVFPSSSLIILFVEFSLFFLLLMSSGEGGRDAVPFRCCCRWSSFVPFVLCVLVK